MESDEVEAVVGELAASGTLDDARFARRYAEDKRELAGWGEERIRLALEQRGVAQPEIEEALADASCDEMDRAVAQLQRRGRPPSDALERNRAFGYLMRRGYSSEIAYEAIRRTCRDG